MPTSRSSTRNVRDTFGRFGVNVDGTYYASFKGQHTFKAGVQWERLSNDVLTGAQAPTVTLNLERLADHAGRLAAAGARHLRLLHRGPHLHRGQIHSNNVGVLHSGCLDDQQPADAEPAASAPMRENDPVLSAPRIPSLSFGLGDKIAPRVGFAYDMKGDGRWKAYGSWGMFYDISKLEMPRGAWGADHWIDYHYTLDTFNWPSINCEGPAGLGLRRHVHRAGRPPARVSNDAANNLIDPNLKPIRTQEFTLGLDHELTPHDVGRRALRAQVAGSDD